jgi:hypothetical protein
MFNSNERRLLVFYNYQMTRAADYKEILGNAVVAFRKATGLHVEIVRHPGTRAVTDGKGDGLGCGRIRVKKGETRWEFDVEVKPWLNTAEAGLFQQEHANLKKWALVTRHTNVHLAERLHQMGIQFIDTDGNAFLECRGLFLRLQGRKPAVHMPRRIVGQPFKPAGMQVIFALICIPGLELRNYREIAALAGVALGTVNETLRGLKLLGYLLEGKEIGRRIVRREELYDQWVGIYPQQLKPRVFRGRYAARDLDWWRTANVEDLGALWGGETAVARETGNLRPEIATIYTKGEPAQVITRYRLREDIRGNVELFTQFWNFQWDQGPRGVVPAPLTYADLLANGEGRNLEAAKDLRESKLARYFK